MTYPWRVLGVAKGRNLELIEFRHPFYDRMAPVYLGEYVTLDTGTGVVHSAPAYGVEDFLSCRRYGMKDEEILTPVMSDGRYDPSLPYFGGLSIWKANPKIVALMAERGVILSATDVSRARADLQTMRVGWVLMWRNVWTMHKPRWRYGYIDKYLTAVAFRHVKSACLAAEPLSGCHWNKRVWLYRYEPGAPGKAWREPVPVGSYHKRGQNWVTSRRNLRAPRR